MISDCYKRQCTREEGLASTTSSELPSGQQMPTGTEVAKWGGGDEGRLGQRKGCFQQQWCMPKPTALPSLDPASQVHTDLHSDIAGAGSNRPGS